MLAEIDFKRSSDNDRWVEYWFSHAVEIVGLAAHRGASDSIGQRKACLLSAAPSFAGKSRAGLAAFGGVDAEESNTLAVDFNGVAVDDRSDADDAILRDRTQYDGKSEQ